MRFTPVWIALPFACLPLAASAQTYVLEATLDGAQATCAMGSTARGSATALLEVDGANAELTWNVTYGTNAPDYDNGLLDGGAETGAHFHGPAPPGMNAGVVLDLEPGSPKIGSEMLDEASIYIIIDSFLYVDVHSAACPLGEIRGQLEVVEVQSVPGLGAPLLALLGAALALGGTWSMDGRRRAGPTRAAASRPRRNA